MRRVLFSIGLVASIAAFAQEDQIDFGEIHGNFQSDFQYYIPDSTIGAPEVPEKFRINAFMNLNYTRGNFSAGLRYETYQNVLLGFDERYRGSGIPYYYARYQNDGLDITVGNFYEQFGSGIVLRSYEERNLGYDNAINGVRVKYSFKNGVALKGLVGQQRYYFAKGEGIVRGIDGEIPLHEVLSGWKNSKIRLTIGGSFVSKFQDDKDPRYNLPLNVGSTAGRARLVIGKFNLYGEYAYKINDPSTVNNFIYKDGKALLFTASYSTKGLGIVFATKRIDNMNFRSDRTATVNDLLINYLPAYTRQHTYTLPALYPYATQPNGEVGYQLEVNYKVKKDTWLGGKYGIDILAHFSIVDQPDISQLNDTTPLYTPGTDGYVLNFWGTGGKRYFRDISFEVAKKLTPKLKILANYVNIQYNKDVIEGKPGFINMQAGVIEWQYKLKPKHTLRGEVQGMFLKDDPVNPENTERGDWLLVLFEYSVSPHWFFAVQDAYNYGNPVDYKQVHYPLVSMGYLTGASRIQLNYGKQQEGIFCVGGVCRTVPASNGLFVTISSTF
jgi:hypothetical protein